MSLPPGSSAQPTPYQPLLSNRKAVNIVAMGSSRSDFTTIQMTENRPEILDGAETWLINYLGASWYSDRIIHVDPVHPYLGNKVVMDLCQKSAKHGTPFYTSWPHPQFPNHVLFPFDKVAETLRSGYMNTSVSAAIALALYEGFNEIGLFGCDFSYPDAHLAESGRACCEFWLGVASQRGVKIAIAAKSTLLDMNNSQHPYGWFKDPMQPPVMGGGLMNANEIIEHCRRIRQQPQGLRAPYEIITPTVPGSSEPISPGLRPMMTIEEAAILNAYNERALQAVRDGTLNVTGNVAVVGGVEASRPKANGHDPEFHHDPSQNQLPGPVV